MCGRSEFGASEIASDSLLRIKCPSANETNAVIHGWLKLLPAIFRMAAEDTTLRSKSGLTPHAKRASANIGMPCISSISSVPQQSSPLSATLCRSTINTNIQCCNENNITWWWIVHLGHLGFDSKSGYIWSVWSPILILSWIHKMFLFCPSSGWSKWAPPDNSPKIRSRREQNWTYWSEMLLTLESHLSHTQVLKLTCSWFLTL